jgi:hypothetical protein
MTLWRASAALAASTCVAVAVGFAVAHPKSSRLLAMALLSQHAHGGVAFVDEYRYDVPFYLRDASAVRVVSNWDPAEVRQHDNWRKEMADAGGFSPEAAAIRLIGEADFRSDLCSGRIRWVVARLDSVKRYTYLNLAQRIATDRDSALWRIDASNPALFAGMGCINVSLATARTH